ncbi:hypothetical protein GQ42DRAFT_164932 [Ramicandelaber brevisporus]|nr:hypothetical protein GQ42DRAFT_165103 [Ramicandelaber brevisporus]KAI8867227.1 hypothetical protein GQ42DRAFT_164932 [Ramicandelaber brevisporus]
MTVLTELQSDQSADRRLLQDLDRRRLANRTAAKAIQEQKQQEALEPQLWVSVGGLFVQLPSSEVIDMLDGEQTDLELEVADARKRIRERTVELQRLAGQQYRQSQ